jgi:prolyl oligopeptidase
MLKKLLLISLLIVSCSKEVYRGETFVGTTVTDIYHGIEVHDPYRNLENLKDTIVLNWMSKQNEYAESIVHNIDGRSRLLSIQEEINNSKKHSVRYIRITNSGAYYYLKRFANEKVFSLYFRDSLNGEEKKIFDIRKYKNYEKNHIINYIKPNWEGSKVAISISKIGNEISKIIILDTKTNKILPYEYDNAAPASVGGIYWLSDNMSFVCSYLPYTDPSDENFWLDTRTYLYKVGEEKGKDIFSKNNNPELSIDIEDFPVVYNSSEEDTYLFGQIAGEADNLNLYYTKESNVYAKKTTWKLLASEREKITQYVIDGDSILYMTSKNASNFKICKTSIKNPNFESPKVLVDEQPESVITNFEITKDGLFYVLVKNGVEAQLFYSNSNESKEIRMPFTSGKISLGVSQTNDSDMLWISIRGWTKPTTTYIYNVNKDTFKEMNFNDASIPEGFENFIAEEIEIPSHDGTMLPVSLIYNEGLKKDGTNRVLFYGYGAYGASSQPFFSTDFLLWAKEGGMIVIPHVRGGGEKGDAWHKAGMKTTKPNTWKDLIATAEYMINENYTTPERTAIWGVSAAGIMLGRAITERPDLFKVMIGMAPAMNMMRSEFQPNGLNSIKEFGTVKDSLEFRALLEMDSFHQIKKGEKYPAVLILTGLKDSRVVAWDPAKFIAKMLDYSASTAPILFLVDSDTGHGGMGSTQSKFQIDHADAFSFALWQTGHPDYKLDTDALKK